MVTNQIKHQYTDVTLYKYSSELTIRKALEKAVTGKVNLYGADLYGADLRGAYLYGAYLYGAYLYRANLYEANLSEADLRRADLYDANLRRADLYGADLRGANLRRADLSEADLRGAKITDDKSLIGQRPFFQCGPIGSRNDHLLSFITDKGIHVKVGCFDGSLDEFAEAVQKTHEGNDHVKEYEMAILMIEAHAAIWTPKGDKK
jgi:hypothetical protein